MPITPQTSTSQAEAKRFSLIMLITVQGTTPKYSSMRGPALDGGDGAVGLLHPAFDHGAELCHLQERGFGDVVGGDVLLDGGELRLHRVVRVLQPIDAAEDFGEIDGFDRDAGALQKFFAIADGVESRGARADGADAQIAEAAHDAADRGEPREVLGEALGVGCRGVERREGVRNAVLHQVVAGGHLSAEAVAAIGDLHVVGAVRRGLHQHRHLQCGVADGVDDAALLAEIRQRDDDAVDLLAVLAEKLGATSSFIGCFYGAELRLLRRERDDADAGLFEHTDHRLSTFLSEVIGKETTVSNNQCKR